jgi:uncharacterized DUF497 family protein
MIGLECASQEGCTNVKKHGVFFEEAATVFTDASYLTIPDPIPYRPRIRSAWIRTLSV